MVLVLEVEEWGGKGAFERGVSGRMISLFSFPSYPGSTIGYPIIYNITKIIKEVLLSIYVYQLPIYVYCINVHMFLIRPCHLDAHWGWWSFEPVLLPHRCCFDGVPWQVAFVNVTRTVQKSAPQK